jgi:hypothetical protein
LRVNHILATVPDFDIGRIRKVQRQYCNAFKHAETRKGKERDDSDLLGRFNDTVNEHTLYVGWYDYFRAVGSLPLEAQVFKVWYLCLYPEKVDAEVDLTALRAVFPDLPSMARANQKKALRKVIEFYRTDPDLTSNRATDPKPLVL